MSTLIRTILLCSLLSTTLCIQASTFSQGLEAYEAGNYAAANAHFQASLAEEETAATRHNLALSAFQAGRKAEAAWQIERAIRIEPFQDEYRFKSEALREHLGLIPQRPRWYQLFAQALPLGQWALLAVLGLWAIVLGTLLPLAARRKAGLPIQAARALGIIALLASVPAYILQNKLNQTGIVISEEPITLHAAPANATPETGSARPGERAQVIDRHGNYYKVKTEGQATGWIPTEAFRPIIEPKTDA